MTSLEILKKKLIAAEAKSAPAKEAADKAHTIWQSLQRKREKLTDIEYRIHKRIQEIEISPPKGKFICYKRCNGQYGAYVLVTLEVPAGAKTYKCKGERKCRASSAKVISMVGVHSRDKYKTAYSNYDKSFIYEVGKVVKPRKKFAKNGICASGIHFFMRKQDAMNY